MITLRDYQVDLISKARGLMSSGCKSILIQAPTGAGKTVLVAHMLKTAASKGMSSWFVMHRRELLKQSIRAFNQVGLNFGVISAGFMEERKHLVQICSIQTLTRRWQRYKQPRLIVYDEVQHMAAKSWDNVYKSQANAFHVGLSATPARLDGKGLGSWFKEMIHGPSVSSLIERGYLAKYKLYAPSNVNLSGVHRQMGDFNKKELGVIMDKPTITGEAVNHYLKYASGKRALVRAVSIEHSKHIASQFNAAGIVTRHVDGETPTEERDYAMEMFAQGKIMVICFVELFSEGVDIPGIEAIIDLRPTQSLTLWLQFCGRALRPAPNKECAIICDAVGNVQRHGLPDEERIWSLEDIERRKQSADGSSESVRTCGKCFAVQKFGSTVCKFCGYTFELKPREVKQVDGELSEVDIEALRRKGRQEQGRAQTMEELVAISKKRGHKRPYAWAAYVFRARQAKKLAGLR